MNEKQIVPKMLSALVYLLFVLGIVQIIYSFTGATAAYGRFYPAAQVVLNIGMFAALSGVLSMEKWGVWLFLTILVVRILLDFQVGAFHPVYLLQLVPAAVFIRAILLPPKTKQ